MWLVSTVTALVSEASRERVWAIGDLHGDAECARHWVERTGLIMNASAPPASWRWTDESSQLVFMGDFIDRGPQARDVLVFVRELVAPGEPRTRELLGSRRTRPRRVGTLRRILPLATAVKLTPDSE